MKILCVDDSKAIHAYMEEVFSGSGYTLDHVLNGQEAVAKLKAVSPGAYDAILLDWEMPVMDGPSTLDAFRQINNRIPVLMVTTKNDFSDIAAALSKGASDYVMKPFTKDILFGKIEQVTGKKVA